MQLSIQQSAIGTRSLALAVLVIVAALWVFFSAASVPSSASAGIANNTCLNESDVLQAADQSRNGIPTSCTVDSLNLRAAVHGVAE